LFKHTTFLAITRACWVFPIFVCTCDSQVPIVAAFDIARALTHTIRQAKVAFSTARRMAAVVDRGEVAWYMGRPVEWRRLA
jgi:hypothetical protein